MVGIVFAFLFVGYALAWSGFGKLVTGGSSSYNLSSAFTLGAKQGTAPNKATVNQQAPTIAPIGNAPVAATTPSI